MLLMPLLAILLSILGLVPFVVCGLAALGPNSAAASQMMSALLSYAALVLAFAGGVHWGFELQSPQSDAGIGRVRLALAIAGPLVGWVAALLAMAAAWAALIVLIVGYIGAVLLEQEAARRGLLPPRYPWLRWGFTLVAVAMLVTVLTLHLLGQTIKI